MSLMDGPFLMPLDKAMKARSWMMVTLKMAFMAGSSKQGKVFLACVACICEVAMMVLLGVRAHSETAPLGPASPLA